MGKITVKHFLNVNLKPYLVRGEKFYPVYLLITVNQKTTRVKSHCFSELQTESEFEEILKSKEAGSEIYTVTNLISAQVDYFKNGFDTNLFSAYYNLTPRYPISNSSTFKAALINVPKIEGLYYSLLFCPAAINEESGLTFYEWFTPEAQRINSKLLKKMKFSENTREQLNAVVLISFFEVLQIIVNSQRKYDELRIKYPDSLKNFHQLAQIQATKIE